MVSLGKPYYIPFSEEEKHDNVNTQEDHFRSPRLPGSGLLTSDPRSLQTIKDQATIASCLIQRGQGVFTIVCLYPSAS